jgi:DNA invertase Pin-like site-specific DNA recombinase
VRKRANRRQKWLHFPQKRSKVLSGEVNNKLRNYFTENENGELYELQPKVIVIYNPEPFKRLKTAVYVRVTGFGEEALNSLAYQTYYYQNLIQRNSHKWEFVRIYADESVTGTKENRPEFNRMLEDCRAGKIDQILCKSIYRFARNTVVSLQTLSELKTLNIDVWFEIENLHSLNHKDDIMISLISMRAQQESKSASEQAHWRVKKEFEKGNALGFHGMYGYDYIFDANTGKSSIKINEKQARIVRKIFEWYINGEGSMKIAKRLNDAKILTFDGKNWTDLRICQLIQNEKYKGDALLGKRKVLDFLTKKQVRNRGQWERWYVQNNHPPIISEEVWELANKLKKERANRFNKGNETVNRYEFSGKITCENCGKHYKRKKCLRGFNWQCTTFLIEGKAKCPAKAIPEDILQQLYDQIGGSEKVDKISVPGANKLKFYTKNSDCINVEWKDRSRSESWTPEMKEKARRDAIKGNEIKKRKN